GGVEHNDDATAFGLLNLRHEFAFMVGLEELDRHAESLRPFAHLGLDFCQGGLSVDALLTLTEQVQIRSIEEKHFHCGATLGQAGGGIKNSEFRSQGQASRV